MKRLLTILFSFFYILGQAQTGSADFTYLNVRNSFGPPLVDTIAAPYKIGEFRTRPQDNLWYRYNGKPTGQQRWDYIYFGPTNSITPTLDQVLARGNTSGVGINVGTSTFSGVKIPSIAITGQVLMVVVNPDGTFSAQTIPGAGSTISSLNGTTSANQKLLVAFNVATAPKWSDTGTAHTINLPILSGVDTGIVTPALFTAWQGKYTLPGSGTSLQYINGLGNLVTFPSLLADSGQFTVSGGGIAITGVWPHLNFAVSGGGGGGITGLGGDVVATGTGTISATIQPNVVSYAKFQQVAASRLLGNATGSSTNVTELSLSRGLIFGTSNTILVDSNQYVTQFDLLSALSIKDTTWARLPIFIVHGTKDTIAVKNDSAAWNAKALQGFPVSATSPTSNQVLVFNSGTGVWTPAAQSGGGGSGTTNLSINRYTNFDTIYSSTGTAVRLDTTLTSLAGLESVWTYNLLHHKIYFFNAPYTSQDTLLYSNTDTLFVKTLTPGFGLGHNVTQTNISYYVDTVTYNIHTGGFNDIRYVLASTFFNPMTTTGDIIYKPTGSVAARLGIGSTNNIMMVNAGLPSWQPQTAITSLGTVTVGVWNATAITTLFGGNPTSGTVGQVLTKNSSSNYDYSWANPPSGFSNPMTTYGDIIYSNSSAIASRLPGNTTSSIQFLAQTGTGTISGTPIWTTVSKTTVGLGAVENTALSTWPGSTNIVTVGTIATGIWGGTAIATSVGGVPTGGTTGQVLTKSSNSNYAVVWQNAASTFTNPMTTAGDMIINGSSAAPTRLAIGTQNQILMVISSSPTWSNQNQITQLGTINTGIWNGTAVGIAYGGAPSGGTTGQVLTKNSGSNYDYAWTTPSGSGPGTIFYQVIQSGGVGVTQRASLNFSTQFSIADDPSGNRSFVAIAQLDWSLLVNTKTIYTADGTMTGNRNFNLGGNSLNISNGTMNVTSGLTYANGTQGANKILVSDASGNANWSNNTTSGGVSSSITQYGGIAQQIFPVVYTITNSPTGRFCTVDGQIAMLANTNANYAPEISVPVATTSPIPAATTGSLLGQSVNDIITTSVTTPASKMYITPGSQTTGSIIIHYTITDGQQHYISYHYSYFF